MEFEVEIDYTAHSWQAPSGFDKMDQCQWKGWFEQFGKRTDMILQNMQMDMDGNIFGNGRDAVGEFTINGLDKGYDIDADDEEGSEEEHEIQFFKQYIGAHTVIYNGSLHGKKIIGVWEIPDNCDGEFEIKMPVRKWIGFFSQNKQEEEMEVYLKIRYGRLFGFGEDHVGRFYIRGYHDPAQSCVSFIKSYLGKHQVHYNGCLVNQGFIAGQWVVPGDDADSLKGKFELKWAK